MEQSKWITCGGCGADHPKDRCLGCWHEFDPQINAIENIIQNKCDEYMAKTSDVIVQVNVKAEDIGIESAKRYAFEAGSKSVMEELRATLKRYAELQVKCDRYEAALRVLSNQGWAVGAKGCTWGDTEYDSESAAIGFNDSLANTIKIANEALSAGEGEKPAKEIEYMPVHPEDLRKPGCPRQVPMHLLNEDQAQSNHGQTLKRLKERGGLSVTEMLAIIQRRKWEGMKWDDALKMLNDVLNQKEDKQ